MKYVYLTILLGGGLAPVFAADQAEPLQPFLPIVQSNMFDPNRGLPTPLRSADGAPIAPLGIPTAALTLAGVGILRGHITAVCTGSSAELSGIHVAGDHLADLVLEAIDLQGATLTHGKDQFRLPVGSSLTKMADTPWQVSATAPAAGSASSSGAVSPAAAGAAPAGDDSNDILRRMRERRQKELNP